MVMINPSDQGHELVIGYGEPHNWHTEHGIVTQHGDCKTRPLTSREHTRIHSVVGQYCIVSDLSRLFGLDMEVVNTRGRVTSRYRKGRLRVTMTPQRGARKGRQSRGGGQAPYLALHQSSRISSARTLLYGSSKVLYRYSCWTDDMSITTGWGTVPQGTVCSSLSCRVTSKTNNKVSTYCVVLRSTVHFSDKQCKVLPQCCQTNLILLPRGIVCRCKGS